MKFLECMLFTSWVLYCFHHQSYATVIGHSCSSDIDCLDSNYCDHDSMSCESCIPCGVIFNRAAPMDNQKCARTEDDCGVCLPGYQSEDLTGQRRSYNCYPILQDKYNEGLESNSFMTGMMSWSYITSLSAMVVLFAAILVAFATYYVKSLSHALRGPQSGPITDGLKYSDTLPPPYNQVLESRQCYTIGSLVQQEVPNQATPIGRFHTYGTGDDLDPEDLGLDLERRSEVASTVGSTETIPSLWEPSSDLNPNDVLIMRPQETSRLVRSCSLTTGARPSIHSEESSSRSCPNLPSPRNQNGINSHRHVRLSLFRRPATDESVGAKMEEEQYFDFSEPLPPHSFSFEDAEESQQNNSGRARILFRSFSAPEESSQVNLEPDYLNPVGLSVSITRARCEGEVLTTNNKRRRKE